MAVYLGSDRVGVTLVRKGTGGSGVKYASGKVTSDENGVVTFPKLDFTPNMITVWNVSLIDHKEIVESWGEEWSDDNVRYSHDGVILTAIYIDGKWISQGLAESSGGVYITNESASGGTLEFLPNSSSSGISLNDGVYSYLLCRYKNSEHLEAVANMEYNYAIYG